MRALRVSDDKTERECGEMRREREKRADEAPRAAPRPKAVEDGGWHPPDRGRKADGGRRRCDFDVVC